MRPEVPTVASGRRAGSLRLPLHWHLCEGGQLAAVVVQPHAVPRGVPVRVCVGAPVNFAAPGGYPFVAYKPVAGSATDGANQWSAFVLRLILVLACIVFVDARHLVSNNFTELLAKGVEPVFCVLALDHEAVGGADADRARRAGCFQRWWLWLLARWQEADFGVRLV